MIVSENNRIRKEHKEENKVFQIYRGFFQFYARINTICGTKPVQKKILKAPTKLN